MPYLSTVGIPDKSYHERRKCSVVSHKCEYIMCVYIDKYVFVYACKVAALSMHIVIYIYNTELYQACGIWCTTR